MRSVRKVAQLGLRLAALSRNQGARSLRCVTTTARRCSGHPAAGFIWRAAAAATAAAPQGGTPPAAVGSPAALPPGVPSVKAALIYSVVVCLFE